MNRRVWLQVLFGTDLMEWVGKRWWNWKLNRYVREQMRRG